MTLSRERDSNVRKFPASGQFCFDVVLLFDFCYRRRRESRLNLTYPLGYRGKRAGANNSLLIEENKLKL